MKDPRVILVIDDDRLVRHVICHTLENDFNVMEAASGMEGIAIAQTTKPDLILLDVMMPGIDGFESCQRLRAQTVTANVPVIMLTALDQVDAKIRGLQAGADDYLTKPFNLDELKVRVQAHLRRSSRDLSASPLTFLPGNPAIERELTERIARREPFSVLYIDLNNFKSYNDEYGWLNGDTVIKLLAKAIQTSVASNGTADDFIGHIGGDDFIVVSVPSRSAAISQEIITLFDGAIPSYYDPAARQRGYIETVDRRGKRVRMPFTSVAIAIVTNERHKLNHPAQIAAFAAEVKKIVKAHTGSHYAFDRRSK
jgi:PleD family two-component response regulator